MRLVSVKKSRATFLTPNDSVSDGLKSVGFYRHFLLLLLLVAPAAFAHDALLSWGPSPSQSVQYNVYRATTPGTEDYSNPYVSAIVPNCSSRSTCQYDDLAVAPGETYYWTVTVCWITQPTNCSSPSNEASGTIPIAAPTGLKVTSSN